MKHFETGSLNPHTTERPFSWGRSWFLRSEMDRLLSCSMLFSCLLILLRVIHTGRLTFLFLIWNLFLAYIPYAFSGWMTRKFTRLTPVAFLLFLVWVLFIPNSFYILTDLFHLADHYNDQLMPQWFDLAMILSFAWNGLLLGILSVRQMEKFLNASGLLFIYPVMWLNALGVYTGRFLRYNSWEILSNPLNLLADIAGMILHPFQNHTAWDMIFCYSILLTLMYLMLKRISHTLA